MSRGIRVVDGTGDHEFIHKDELDEVEEAFIVSRGGRGNVVLDG